jgi:hypothetical protein
MVVYATIRHSSLDFTFLCVAGKSFKADQNIGRACAASSHLYASWYVPFGLRQQVIQLLTLSRTGWNPLPVARTSSAARHSVLAELDAQL